MKFDLRFLALWVAVGFVLAVVVGGASGVLGWLGGQRPAIAVLTGGGAFGGTFVADKAAKAGVALAHVDPAYTSQGCSACGRVAKANRPNETTFRCTSCGFAEHADVNAARNIAARGVAWAGQQSAGRTRREL